jgi:uncharacterized protein with HEPN domain
MDFLGHILDAIQRINRHIGTMDLDTFIWDENTSTLRNEELGGIALLQDPNDFIRFFVKL